MVVNYSDIAQIFSDYIVDIVWPESKTLKCHCNRLMTTWVAPICSIVQFVVCSIEEGLPLELPHPQLSVCHHVSIPNTITKQELSGMNEHETTR